MSKITVTGQLTLTGGQLTAKETSVPSPSGPSLWTWGRGAVGRLGHGDTVYKSSPTQVGTLIDWSDISGAGNGHTLAVKTNGTLWAWGKGYNGQLGNGDGLAGSNQSSPVQIGILSDWVSVATGTDFSLALKTNNTLWSWGKNNSGQLGLGDITDRSSPVQVAGGSVWVSISGGAIHSIAVRTNGTLFTWGEGSGGRLGLGNDIDKSVPSQVGGLNTWASCSCSGDADSHTLAIKTDGTLFAWGSNSLGRLGDGTAISRSSPVQVGSDWTVATAGLNFSIAVKTNGALFSWGRSNQGQLGQGNTTTYSSPVQIGALTDWASVDGGEEFTLARKTDGTIWSWGYDGAGRLGLESNYVNRSSPVQIGTDTTWVKVVAAGHHSVAIKTV